MVIPYGTNEPITMNNPETGAWMSAKVEDHTITVYWGRKVVDIKNASCDYTTILTDDKLKFEITDLGRTNNTYEYENEVWVSGQLYTSNKATTVILDKIAWDISYLKIQDYMDLSLRQYISSINGNPLTLDRQPKVNVTPIKEGETTANYEHSKVPQSVKKNDTITYTIRVYNEGMFDAYADEVTVFLPEGLEFIASMTNKEYGWSLGEGNTIKSNYLISSPINRFIYYDENGNRQYNNELNYAELKLECKVSNTLSDTLLTVLSEITKCHAIDNNGIQISDIADRDSEVNNLNTSNKIINDENYQGQEDDDDFEKAQIMLDIQGYTWVDSGEEDIKIKNMLVKLIDENGICAETRTDNSGHYIFSNMPIKQYTIEFEYEGQTYTKSGKTTSYANEDEQKREDINKSFYEITPAGAINANQKLQYETAPGISQLNRNVAPFNKGTIENGYVTFADMSSTDYDLTKIQASTGNLLENILYAENINFALEEREGLMLEVYSDLLDITVQIKGQSQNYTYGARNIKDRTTKDDEYNSVNYTQTIYPSDYEYKKNIYGDKNFANIDELEVYVKYYIKIYNASNEPAQISELAHYYDANYEYYTSVYRYGEKIENLSWSNSPKSAPAQELEGYNLIYTTSLEGITIDPGKQIDIEVAYKVAKDENGYIVLGNKKVATEINGYTSNQGLIDKVSQPGNIENAEKDSDKAPMLNINLNGERSITGFVWEDKVVNGIDGIRKGDGIYNEGETKIKNIEVQLVELLKTTEGNDEEFVRTQMNTGEEGEYVFNNIIPGNYIVRFFYGDNIEDFTYNGQDYKSTVVKVSENGERVSDAIDNKARRKEIMDYTKTLTNEKASILSNPSLNPEEYVNMVAMYADTIQNYEVGIEHDNSKTNSIDFGIAQRPKAGLEITKEIQSVQLTNGGITLVDTANGIDTGVTKIKDIKKPTIFKSFMIALDDELINGAELTITYKIEVTNVGEKDNLANYFEYDPAYGTREEQDKLFTTRANIVYDYTNSLAFEKSENQGWNVEVNFDGVVAQDVKDKINSGEYTVLKTGNLNANLQPGESTSMELKLRRVVSTSRFDDDMVYLNEVEIVQTSNDGGRRNDESVPGNYVPGDEKTSEIDDWNTDLVITNPTGKARTYYELIFISAVILGIGIVGIKKFVLNEK